MACEWRAEKNIHSRCNRRNFGDSPFCIFHKPDKTEDEAILFWEVINYTNQPNLFNKFHDLILSRAERRAPNQNITYNDQETRILSTGFLDHLTGQTQMSGFVFPKLPSDNPIQWQNFRYRHVRNESFNLIFEESIFECPISFNNYVFKGHVSFIGTEFKQGFSFQNATFPLQVEFKNVKGRISDGLFPFKNTKANGYYFIIEDDNLPYFDLSEIDFGRDTDFQLKIKKTKDDSGFGEPLYRIAKKQAIQSGNNAKASEYHFWERYYRDIEKAGLKALFNKNFYRNSKDTRRRTLSEIKQKLKGTFSRKLVGYGEKPWRALILGVFIVPFFAFIYLFTGLSIYHFDKNDEITNSIILKYSFDLSNFNENLSFSFLKQFWDDYTESLFYSASTFSTASFGSIPLGGASQFFTTLEMALGIIIFGIFTATYLNKLLK